MRDYGIISPRFWVGETGKRIKREGPELQVLALYLMSSPHANMLGLYYLPKILISHEAGIPLEGASKGLYKLKTLGFCEYDEDTEMIFVLEMAKYQICESLNSSDNRVKGICKLLKSMPKTRLTWEWWQRYKGPFSMPESEAPSKPLRSQEQEQEQEQETILKPLPSDKSEGREQENDKNDDSGYKELAKASKPKKSKYSFSDDHHQLAVWMSCPVKRRFPTQDVDLDKWADTVRKLMEIDGYTQKQVEWLWRAITTDERQGFSWSQNCRTPMKLREKKDGLSYFEIIKNQFAGGQRNASNQPGRDTAAAPKRQSLIERTNAQARAIIAECEAEEAGGGIVGSYD